MKKVKENEIKGIENQIKDMEEELQNTTNPEEKAQLEKDIIAAKENQENTTNEVASIEKKVEAIKDLSKKYDLKNL